MSLFSESEDNKEVYVARLKWALSEVKIVNKLLKCVCDRVEDVAVHAVGALVNIAIVGGVTACDHMLSCDLLTALIPIVFRVRQYLLFSLYRRVCSTHICISMHYSIKMATQMKCLLCLQSKHLH